MPNPAIPTAVKQLAGNPGKRPLNRREPKPRSKRPKMPAHLTPDARTEWLRVMRIMQPTGVITEAEADILAVYCMAYAQWVQAFAIVQRLGLIMVTPAGLAMRNPALKIVDDAQRTMLRCMGELGMTPSARVRLVAPESAGDAFEAFLNDL